MDTMLLGAWSVEGLVLLTCRTDMDELWLLD